MAGSSHYNLDKMMDDKFDQCIDQALENYGDCRQAKPTTKHDHIERYREQGHIQLWNDYFRDDLTFPLHIFRRLFRIKKLLFMRIVDRIDATGRLGFSALQKATTTIRMMAYGLAADTVDKYLGIGESTSMLCLENFVEGIIYLFGDECLRRPTQKDLIRLLHIKEIRGFLEMIESIGSGRIAPSLGKGQYTRGSEKSTIVLEAVAS